MIEILNPLELARAKVTGALVADILQSVKNRSTVGTNLLEIDGWVQTMIAEAGAQSCYVDYAPAFGRGPFGHYICTSVNDAVLQSARYADIGLDITRIIFTKEQNEWIDAPYTPNPYNVDSLKYETIGKLPVRSSSEREIGNMFEDIGLPYRSDDLVRIIRNDEHQGTPFRNTYFADFKVPNLLGGITVHEHLGAFHLENYSDNALQRLNDYHNFTVVELPGRPVGKNELTWSFESDLQGDENLKRLIARLLLPGIC